MCAVKYKYPWCFTISAIVLLIGVATYWTPKISPCKNARNHATHAVMDSLLRAVIRYEHDCYAPPTTQQGLVALVENPGIKCWKGPYVPSIPCDSWGKAFQYQFSGDRITITSLGRDRKAGTKDDIHKTSAKFQGHQISDNKGTDNISEKGEMFVTH
jgi:type II secretion system protein G